MNRKVKRVSQLLVVGILSLSLLLVGCSKEKSSGSGDKDGITRIKFWHPYTDTGLEGINAVIKAFEDANPKIKVDSTYIANQGEGQNEKLLAAIAGNNPPDVAYFDRFEIGSWANQGSLEDLSQMAATAGITKEKYYPFAWDEASYQGKLYGLPTTTDSRLVYFNVEHFEEVGLDPNNPPKTIAELEEAAEKLTKKDGKRFERIGFIPWYSQGWLYSWGWAFGGDFYDANTNKVTANDPKVVEALQWLTDYAKKYDIEDISAFQDSQGSGAMDPFISGQLSMQISGPWVVPGIKKFKPDMKYGVFPIPTPTGTDFTTWSGGWSVVMPKGAKNKEAAFELMKFFGSEDGQTIFSEIINNFSAIDSVNEKLGYKEDPILKHFVDILPVLASSPCY